MDGVQLPLWGGSLISTTKFPEMHGTTLEVKAESNLEPPSGTLEAIAPWEGHGGVCFFFSGEGSLDEEVNQISKWLHFFSFFID